MDTYIKNRLRIEIEKAYYIAKRYKSASSFAILYFECDLNITDLGHFLRISDHLLKTDDKHYFIHFSFGIIEPST